MRIFSFTGWSGSGKTTLISKLIKELTGRGFKTAAVKHVPEKFYLEPESKDSFKFLKNGATESFLLASGELISAMLTGENFDFFSKMEKRLKNYDIILCEGISHPDYPLFEIYNSGNNPVLKSPLKELTALIGDKKIMENILFFNRDEISVISDYMETFPEK